MYLIHRDRMEVLFMKWKKSILILVIILIIVTGNLIYIKITKKPKENLTEIELPIEKTDYNYAELVPEAPEIEDEDYFKDAIFIGDSRTEGFMNLTGLNTTFFTHIGLTVSSFFNDPVISLNGKKLSILEAIKESNFKKVYIMLGINETGWQYSDLFYEKYKEIIEELKKINTEATIYIESILPVSKEVSENHSYIKKSKIDEYNVLLKKLAKEQKVYYLDIASSLVNEEGYLPQEAANDGIHLNKEYTRKWLQYLKTHYIVDETQERSEKK